MYFSVPMIVPCAGERVVRAGRELERARHADRARGHGTARGLRLEHLRDAEVEDLEGAGVHHEDVVGLEIAVDDALARGRNRSAFNTVHHDLDGARVGQRWPFADRLGQRLAVEELEHHVRRAAVLADFVDDDDVVVLAAGRRARLDEEALGQLGLVRLQELDRDAAAEPEIAREVDGPHPALADHLDHLVLVDPHARMRRRRGGVDAGRVTFEVRVRVRVPVPLARAAGDRARLRATSRARLTCERLVHGGRCRLGDRAGGRRQRRGPRRHDGRRLVGRSVARTPCAVAGAGRAGRVRRVRRRSPRSGEAGRSVRSGWPACACCTRLARADGGERRSPPFR